jgi:hypothetical protein
MEQPVDFRRCISRLPRKWSARRRDRECRERLRLRKNARQIKALGESPEDAGHGGDLKIMPGSQLRD